MTFFTHSKDYQVYCHLDYFVFVLSWTLTMYPILILKTWTSHTCVHTWIPCNFVAIKGNYETNNNTCQLIWWLNRGSAACLPWGRSRNGGGEWGVKEVVGNAGTLPALPFFFTALASSQKSNALLSYMLTVCVSKTHQISLSHEHDVTCSWRGSSQF